MATAKQKSGVYTGEIRQHRYDDQIVKHPDDGVRNRYFILELSDKKRSHKVYEVYDIANNTSILLAEKFISDFTVPIEN
jgi:hypothetical protein